MSDGDGNTEFIKYTTLLTCSIRAQHYLVTLGLYPKPHRQQQPRQRRKAISTCRSLHKNRTTSSLQDSRSTAQHVWMLAVTSSARVGLHDRHCGKGRGKTRFADLSHDNSVWHDAVLWGRLPMAESTPAFPSIMRQSGALALVYAGGAASRRGGWGWGGGAVWRPPGEASATLPCIQEFVHDIHKRRSVPIVAFEEETVLDPMEFLGAPCHVQGAACDSRWRLGNYACLGGLRYSNKPIVLFETKWDLLVGVGGYASGGLRRIIWFKPRNTISVVSTSCSSISSPVEPQTGTRHTVMSTSCP